MVDQKQFQLKQKKKNQTTKTLATKPGDFGCQLDMKYLYGKPVHLVFIDHEIWIHQESYLMM